MIGPMLYNVGNRATDGRSHLWVSRGQGFGVKGKMRQTYMSMMEIPRAVLVRDVVSGARRGNIQSLLVCGMLLLYRQGRWGGVIRRDEAIFFLMRAGIPSCVVQRATLVIEWVNLIPGRMMHC
jgi:hypothetical protein